MNVTKEDVSPTPGAKASSGERIAVIDVGLDGCPGSWGALTWATDIAHRTGARIRIVTSLQHARAKELQARDDMSRTNGKRLLRSAVHTVHQTDSTIQTDTVLTDEPIATYLGALSRTTDLTVIGGRNSGPIRDSLFGHNASRVVASSESPVVVWRARTPQPTGHCPIVVGVDNSDSSSTAIAFAFRFADTTKSQLTVIHVEPSRHHPADRTDVAAEPSEDCLGWLRGRIAPYAQRHPRVDVHLHCIGASLVQELRRISASAQLVVIGSDGCGPIEGALRRSTVQQLVHSSGGPIAIVS